MAPPSGSGSSRTGTRSRWARRPCTSRLHEGCRPVILATPSLDNQNLLRALEILVVALIWLFFFRVIRAVWVEVRPPKMRSAGPDLDAADLARAEAPRRQRGSRL